MSGLDFSGLPVLCGVEWAAGAAGFPKAVLRHGSGAWAEVHLWGATVTHWSVAGDGSNQFWLDDKNCYDAHGPIRGGVPLVFPWFGPHETREDWPRHGFARITGAAPLADRWKSPCAGLFAPAPADAVGLSLVFDFVAPGAYAGIPDFDYRFPACQLGLDVDLDGESLRVVLAVRNESEGALEAEMLLHPYFATGPVADVAVLGLEGRGYQDKNAGGARRAHGAGPFGLVPAPDAVFDRADPKPLVLRRPPLRALVVEPLQRGEVVVWNSGPRPGAGADSAPSFACVEPGRLGAGRVGPLEPGACGGVGMVVRLAAE